MAYEKKDFACRVTDSLINRAVSVKTEASLGYDPIHMGLYAAARLDQAETVLVIILNKSGKAVRELTLPDSILLEPDELTARIRGICEEKRNKRVIVAMHKEEERRFPLKAAVCLRLRKALEKHGITLCGYYLIDGFDFENLV